MKMEPISWQIEGDKRHGKPIIHKTRGFYSGFYNGEKFKVYSDGLVLNKSLEWEYEPIPSSRDTDFFERCRFDTFEEAVSALESVEKEKRP